MTRKMREGDVLIVRLVRPGEPIPRGFKPPPKLRPAHHDLHVLRVTKLIRRPLPKPKRKPRQ